MMVASGRQSVHVPRVVFLGMACAASQPPLAALLDGGFDVRAVVLPAGLGGQRERGDGLGALARSRGAPVLAVRRLGQEEIAAIAAHRPDAVVVACFPWKLPPPLLALPPLGCLNVHPSLLPVGRGPEPVFWTLRRGERRTGATVHLMDAGFDTGPIVAQAAIDVPEGIRAPDLEGRLMALGARLLTDALPRLAAGAIAPVPQDDALATFAPVPSAADFVVPTNLPARWAYTFVRGVAPLDGPLTLHVGPTRQRYPIRDALDHAPDGVIEEPVVDEGSGVLRVRFKPGVVRLLIEEERGPGDDEVVARKKGE